MTKMLSSIKNLLALMMISPVAVFAGEVRVSGPARVEVGTAVKVVVEADGARDADLRMEFGSWRKVQPMVLQVIEAETGATEGKVESDAGASGGKAVVSQKNSYHALMKASLQLDTSEPLYVWARYKGGAICLKNAEDKELQWVWGKPAEWQWRCIGRFPAQEIGKSFRIMSRPVGAGESAGLDAVVLSSSGAFKPAGSEPRANVFTWQTNASSVGTHAFPVKVYAGERLVGESVYKVEVLGGGAQAEDFTWRGSGFEQVPLSGVNITAEPKDPAMRLFPQGMIKADTKKTFGPYGFAFPVIHGGNAGFVGLAKKGGPVTPEAATIEKAPPLPEQVTIPVGRKAAGLAFLHAEIGSADLGERVLTYRVNFENGKTHTVPVVAGESVLGWLKSGRVAKAGRVYHGFNGSISTQVYLMEAAIPAELREQTITSIDVVSAMPSSIPVVLGIGTLSAMKDAASAGAESVKTSHVTIDFGQRGKVISPALFATNESGAGAAEGIDDYNRAMSALGTKLSRFHAGRMMETVFPAEDSQGEFAKLEENFDRWAGKRAGEKILFCFAHPPKWMVMSNPDHRYKYAEQCARLVRFLVQEKKYPITHWELVNEPYMRGVPADRGVWEFYKVLGPKIKAIDPQAKIGGPVLAWPDEGVTEDYLKSCAPVTDFIAWHLYPTGKIDSPTDVLMARTDEYAVKSLQMRRLAEKYIVGRPVEMALTEYNMNYDYRPTDPRQATHVGACWAASVLKHLADAGHEIAQSWRSKEAGTYGLVDQFNEPRPMAELLMLMNRHFAGGRIVGSAASPAVIEALAVEREGERAILLINKSGEARSVDLMVLNGPVGSGDEFARPVRVYEISGAVKHYQQSQAELFRENESGAVVEMAPYSVKIVVFGRDADERK